MDRARIAAANRRAVEQLMAADPVLVDVQPAGAVIPEMTPRTILHAGPPIAWERMCGPMRAAVAGALILEGLAGSEAEAYRVAASGEIRFDACHNHGAVGPMAGVISASMPLFVVRDRRRGATAYCNLNEGRGKVLRYGGLGDEVLARLRWMAEELGPVLQAAVRRAGEIPVRSILAEALHMGDDCHNRYKASSALFVSRLARHVAAATPDRARGERALEFIAANDYTFLNVAMAGQKAMADAAHGVEGSTLVTAMARNGTDFGIRVSGLGSEWFTAPAPAVEALYFPPYGPADANPDLGDSTIAETTGFGGFAAAASPAVVQFVGGTPQQALQRTLDMYEIATAENPAFTIPSLDFRGVPTGIDLLKVLEANILPLLHTGVAHKEPGVGQIGAGTLRAPRQCFVLALEAFGKRYGL